MAKKEAIDEIDNIFKMVDFMREFGIDATGLTTLEEMKKRTKEELSKKFPQGLSEGKDDPIFAETDRKETIDKLVKFYNAAMEILNRDKFIFDSLEMRFGNVKEKIEERISQIEQLQEKGCYILVAGETSSGKSSLVNLILGEKILPESVLSSTSTICELKSGDKSKIIVHFKDQVCPPLEIEFEQKTGCDQSYLEQISSYVHVDTDREGPRFEKIEVFWCNDLLKQGIVIVDSPGIGESAEVSEVVIKYLPKAFAFIYVINCANAGGVQKDRLVDLLRKVRHMSLGVHEEKNEESKMQLSFQEQLLSKCALFVCNKWDQVPERENEKVKSKLIKTLEQCWPGLVPEAQMIYLSTQEATKVQNAGFTSKQFTSLKESLKNMVLRSIEARLELHVRFLDDVLQQINVKSKAHLITASQEREEAEEKMEQIKGRLNSLKKNQEKTMKQLREDFDEEVKEAAQKLHAHLTSEQVIASFVSWTKEKAPEEKSSLHETEEGINRALFSRLKEVIQKWEEETNVFRSARASLIESFEKHYLDVTDQLRNVERAITEDNATLASPDNKIFSSSPSTAVFTRVTGALTFLGVGVASFALSPAFLLALPLASPVLFFKELSAFCGWLKYRSDKSSFLKGPSMKFLEDVASVEKLTGFVKLEFKEVEDYLKDIEVRLPNLINDDERLCKQLVDDRRSKEEIEKLYNPIVKDSFDQRHELAVFGMAKIFSDAICPDDLTCKKDESSKLGSGLSAIVYEGKRRRQGEDQTVAVKVFSESLCEKDPMAIAEEMYRLRKLNHHHIVRFYGIVKETDVSTRVITVMEKCKGDLRSLIFKGPESIPSKSGDDGVLKNACQWAKEICDGLLYTSTYFQKIVRRDLKLENILVSEDNSVRIADVGVTKAAETPPSVGTCVYMAPEVLLGHNYGSEAVIYSLGIILWEIWYGHPAFEGWTKRSLEEFSKSVNDGCRPKHLDGCKEPPTRWKNLIAWCLEGNPASRPTAAICATEMRMQQIEIDKVASFFSVSYEHLEWEKEVSSIFSAGKFCPVYQGIRKRGRGNQSVTLKLCTKEFDPIKARESMALMTKLRSLLQHRCIVEFYGISLSLKSDIVRTTVVLERSKESLRNYLFGDSETRTTEDVKSGTDKDTLKWAEDITEGLAYMHDQNITHGDLKLENIWLSEGNSAKIAVIGMAELAKDITGTSEETPVYMAPEVLGGENHNNASDIYSLGLMFWEMWYRQRAFASFVQLNLRREGVFARVDRGERPTLAENDFPSNDILLFHRNLWHQLMRLCWAGDPKERITARQCNDKIVKGSKFDDAPCNGREQKKESSV